jgi:hypothetical protein
MFDHFLINFWCSTSCWRFLVSWAFILWGWGGLLFVWAKFYKELGCNSPVSYFMFFIKIVYKWTNMFNLVIIIAIYIYMLLWFWKLANAYPAMNEIFSKMHNLYKKNLVEYLDMYPYIERIFKILSYLYPMDRSKIL